MSDNKKFESEDGYKKRIEHNKDLTDILSRRALNKRIDELIKEYESEAEDRIQEYSDQVGADKYFAKIEALNELKIELNDPEPATDLEENVQQSLNVITANKIIKDEL